MSGRPTIDGPALRAGIGALLMALACAGCGTQQRADDFIPEEEAARRALAAYLDAWQRGETSTTIPGTSPVVAVSDGVRAAGRKLEGYSILGPVPADAPRCFGVRLVLASPAEERRERYVVVGLDPVWVFAYPDYEMLMHWDHPLPAKKEAPRPKPQ